MNKKSILLFIVLFGLNAFSAEMEVLENFPCEESFSIFGGKNIGEKFHTIEKQKVDGKIQFAFLIGSYGPSGSLVGTFVKDAQTYSTYVIPDKNLYMRPALSPHEGGITNSKCFEVIRPQTSDVFICFAGNGSPNEQRKQKLRCSARALLN